MSKTPGTTPLQQGNNSPVFASYAHYYDLLYRDKDYQAE